MEDLLITVDDLHEVTRKVSHAVRLAIEIEDSRVTGSVAYTEERENDADQKLRDALRDLQGAMDKMSEKLKD